MDGPQRVVRGADDHLEVSRVLLRGADINVKGGESASRVSASGALRDLLGGPSGPLHAR